MEQEYKRDKIVRLVKDDPFLTIDKIAKMVNTTPRYVRTVLYENNLSLQELRRSYARKWKEGSFSKESLELGENLKVVVREYIDNCVQVQDNDNDNGDFNQDKISNGFFVSKELIITLIKPYFATLSQICKRDEPLKEWVEVLNNIYLVHFRLFKSVKGQHICQYSAGLCTDTVLICSNNSLSLEPKYHGLESKSILTEKDSR
ncbi:MAG TPA: hypothetical protein GX522_09775 [Firmicutes bacterium]|nr:hypothetical protein [Bacillota bacterium]